MVKSENFAVHSRVKQENVISPILFNYVIDWIIDRVVSTDEGVMVGKGTQVTNIDYAAEFAIAEDDLLKSQMMMDKVKYYSAMVGLRIDPIKTKVMYANI
jgi:ABC-type uncharacterized transport system permease subunit